MWWCVQTDDPWVPVSTLEYSIETTMRTWMEHRSGAGGGAGAGPKPMSGQTFRRWLHERLGRNLYVGDAASTTTSGVDGQPIEGGGGYANGTGTGGKMSPGGMLLSTLGPRSWEDGDGAGGGDGGEDTGGGNIGGGDVGGGDIGGEDGKEGGSTTTNNATTTTTTWNGRDLAMARNHLRGLLQRRLDVRCAALERHGVRVVTRPGPRGGAVQPLNSFDSWLERRVVSFQRVES